MPEDVTYTDVDCTLNGVLVLVDSAACLIRSFDPRTGIASILFGQSKIDWDKNRFGRSPAVSNEQWAMRDGTALEARFSTPQRIALCDGDRRAYVLDFLGDLRVLTMPELDLTMYSASSDKA